MESKRYYSSGKLLLTGEYVVLDGAKALAFPTEQGQDLCVSSLAEPLLQWKSYDVDGNCWFKGEFDLPRLRIVSATFDANEDGGKDRIIETLQEILLAAKAMSPDFLATKEGFLVETHLEFDRKWGLGTSSTLIHNIATWAGVDPFQLLDTSFGGSGYDIACAAAQTPITYQKKEQGIAIEEVVFTPSFSEELFFVYLNKKQNSKAGIARYRALTKNKKAPIAAISALTDGVISAQTRAEFEAVLREHEALIASVLQTKTIQESIFSDYTGVVKSLGAWGGDFILVTGTMEEVQYFASKGYTTIIPFDTMLSI